MLGKNGTYQVELTDEVGSIEGSGSIEIADGMTLTAGGLNTDTEVSGVISGVGGFTKVGDGTTTFSGVNTYKGDTNVQSGRLALANVSAIFQESETFVRGDGHLDLYTHSADGSIDEGKTFKIDQIDISGSGQLSVSARNPLISENINLNASSGGITVEIFEKTEGREMNKAPIRVSEKFIYKDGSLIVRAPLSDDPEGTWNIIDGDVENADELAAKTYLVTSNRSTYEFKGVDEPIYGPAMYKGYLEKGSLNLVIEAKTPEELECQVNPDSCNDLPTPEGPQAGNELPDVDGDGIPDHKDPDDDGDGELDALPGCEVGDDLCDVISDIDGDEDEASLEEEEVAGEVIEAVLDGLEDEEIDLALSFDYGQLAKLVGSGLAPRNVDAAGRGIALHNNVLVDAVFERQPLRQFEELLVSDAVVEEETVVEEEAGVDETTPVQPLWLKSEELADDKATAYVEGAVAGVEDADVEVADTEVNAETAGAVGVESEAVVIELDDVSLVDQQDDELDLAKRDGVSAWVKGYGGNSRADDDGILYNDYDLDAYGTSFGVDVALSESFQIGAFANYGDVNVQHRSGDTGGGSWNPEGWGGGLTAQYSARNFYVQGLLGASEFSGEQSRNILQINDQFGGNTVRGDKTVTSYLGALRLGAPFKTGGVVLEPQAQALWTHNREHGFSETSGSEKNLRLKYKNRTTNFMETELGMKLSVPIRTGERGLLVPSVRAAWLADWNRENEGQEIGYKFTKKTATFDSELGTENGALIEAGLDYTIQNFNSTSVKVYARGGMEVWNSDRGTTWRGSGGVTFQF
jgi:autotransporter-associated beta strand protein